MSQRMGSLTPAQIVGVVQAVNDAPCYCDRMGIGEPNASCGDCPTRDYPHMIAKTTSERVEALRADRKAQGLKRMELYAHPEDWPAIKALAEKIQRKRARLLARGSNC